MTLLWRTLCGFFLTAKTFAFRHSISESVSFQGRFKYYACNLSASVSTWWLFFIRGFLLSEWYDWTSFFYIGAKKFSSLSTGCSGFTKGCFWFSCSTKLLGNGYSISFEIGFWSYLACVSCIDVSFWVLRSSAHSLL